MMLQSQNITCIFRVKVLRNKRTYRDIEHLASQTFEDLHKSICVAFDLEGDHLYEFFLDNKPWSQEANILCPYVEKSEGDVSADMLTLGQLIIPVKTKFLYVYDFGSESWFEIEFRGRKTKLPNVLYPRILKTHDITLTKTRIT